MKNKNNVEQEKKPFIRTRTKLDGGKEVDVATSPSNTKFGKVMAFILAAITLFGSLIGLIYLFTQL